MPKYQLTNEQKKLLCSLIDGLKEGYIDTEWIVTSGGDRIVGIFGLNDRDNTGTIWREVWKGVSQADFDDFVECGLFRRINNSGGYTLHKQRIIDACEQDFIRNEGSVVNIDSKLEDVTQTIQNSSPSDEEIRKQLVELITQAENLSHQDNKQLDAIRRRTRLVIRKSFGNDSHYLTELEDIHFRSRAGRAGHRMAQDKAWKSGHDQLLNFLIILKDDLDMPSTPLLERANLIASNRIFVVHGHDTEMKTSVARVLEKLDLEPIILHEQANKGKTIIEKFEENADVNFAVVLFSPDDMVYSKSSQPSSARLRARQNVVLELGYFMESWVVRK